MDRIWAPWRMSYINSIGNSEGCFLCAAAGQEGSDAENLVVWRGRTAFCIMNRFPYNNGHLMVAPYSHKGELEALNGEERAGLLDGLLECQALLRRVMSPHGFNIGLNLGRAAGAGLAEHLHVHIVPRWEGDTNFMPVLADTKVVPQALGDLYEKLKKAAEEGGEA